MSKLKRFYFENLKNERVILTNQEMLHCTKVMRLREGDNILACCGDGFDYICMIEEISKNEVICKVLEKIENVADSKINVTLFQANLKTDKVELIAQKISEIGLNELVLFDSEFCVAKKSENTNKVERLKKIAIESAKQCGRSKALTVGEFLSFNEMVESIKKYDIVLFAYENQRECKITELEGIYDNIAIIIGSEGGFSQSECDILNALPNLKCVTLGKRILRAETASIVASALAMERFEK